MSIEMLLTETDNQYHSNAGKYLSSHLLMAFMKCPYTYNEMVLGRYYRPDTPYFMFGRALHCLVLEGREEFDRRFATDEPINLSTGKPYGPTSNRWKAWADAQKEIGKEVFPGDMKNLLDNMARSVLEHHKAMEVLVNAPYREKVIRCNYLGLPCQIRMDALGVELENQVGLVDFKTCDSLDRIAYAAKDYNYFTQMAFYRAIIREAGLQIPEPIFMIAIEKNYPYRTGVWQFAPALVDEAEEDNILAIERLKECIKTDIWPTGYEDIRLLK